MKTEEYNVILKVILVGGSEVGKTNIVSRYAAELFNIQYISTIGVDFMCKTTMIGASRVKLQIWDTAGKERFKSIVTAYYKNADGAFVVFNVTKKDTFYSVDKLIDELKSLADSDVSIVLIGNKSDLQELRQVSQDEAEAKARHYGIDYFETSALQDSNINQAFHKLTEEFLFDVLAGDEYTIPKSHLVGVIKEFDLPITVEEFFLPIGSKENLSFSDFCYLFKNSEKSDSLLRSFSSGFNNFRDTRDKLFPITINKTIPEL